jgi:AcrR family transcriptional regulator
MSKPVPTVTDWRASRRESARAAILAAAWRLVREQGLAALTLRDLARTAGTTTPTVYSYFASKNAIFDAMFHDAATAFTDRMSQAYRSPAGTPRRMVERANRFMRFCVEDVPRYQLLFQHSIPGFHPSAESYAPAERTLEQTRAHLAECGVTEARHVDLWTGISTGLVAQQIANDPGSDRWTSLVNEAVAMFLAHCRSA